MKLENQENDWLDQQPKNNSWDEANDPDNHFIDNDVERALLSENNEVIVLDDRGNPVIYKFIDDEGNYIAIENEDYAALAQINSGVIPNNNPNVTVFVPERPIFLAQCKDKNTFVSYPLTPTGKIKCTTKLRRKWGRIGRKAISKSKIVAKTKGYKFVRNRWRVRRTLILAQVNGIAGAPATIFVACGQDETRSKTKEKRRRRVRVVEKMDPFLGVLDQLRYITVRDNTAFTVHKQDTSLFTNVDVFDGQ